jgi:hypothetical protein
MAIDVRASFDAEVSSALLFDVIRDLGTYPKWLEIVHFADAAESDQNGGDTTWNG